MKQRPILFSAPMVKAIIAGTKTQTRRLIRNPDRFSRIRECGYCCPYGLPGEGLWVRETWRYGGFTEDGYPFIEYRADGARVLHERYPEEWAERLTDTWAALSAPENYNIDQRAADRRWRPAIHMPRWASRLLLCIDGVRVERLQEIDNEAAEAEGVKCDYSSLSFRDHFAELWDRINGKRAAWSSNPWVWAVQFGSV